MKTLAYTTGASIMILIIFTAINTITDPILTSAIDLIEKQLHTPPAHQYQGGLHIQSHSLQHYIQQWRLSGIKSCICVLWQARHLGYHCSGNFNGDTSVDRIFHHHSRISPSPKHACISRCNGWLYHTTAID